MPIIGAIKNGVKTKVVAKLPNLLPASRTTFDNSGTDLTSNRVQGALVELANRTREVQSTRAVWDTETVYQNVEGWTRILTYTPHYSHSLILMNGTILLASNFGQGWIDYFIGNETLADQKSVYTISGDVRIPIDFIAEHTSTETLGFGIWIGMTSSKTYRIGGSDTRSWVVRIIEIPLP
jgi:hypothetical protein